MRSHTSQLIRLLLRGVIGLFVLVLLCGQILVPIEAREVGDKYWEVTHLVIPYSVMGILTLACFQVAAIVVGFILTAQSTEFLYTATNRFLIKLSGSLCVLGSLIPAGTGIHLLTAVNVGGLPEIIVIIVGFAAAIGFVCLTYLALTAFDTAYREHEELGAVI